MDPLLTAASDIKLQYAQLRFTVPEVLFMPELFGRDDVSIAKNAYDSIQACAVDDRRELWQNIVISGGLGSLPGLENRICSEMNSMSSKYRAGIEKSNCDEKIHAEWLGAKSLSCVVARQGLESMMGEADFKRYGSAGIFDYMQ